MRELYLPSIDSETIDHHVPIFCPIQMKLNWDFAYEGKWKILGSPNGDWTQDLQHRGQASLTLDHPAAHVITGLK